MIVEFCLNCKIRKTLEQFLLILDFTYNYDVY